MLHPGDGVLRRMLDEPAATADSSRRHVDACGRCQRRQALMRADAERAGSLLGSGPATVEGASALMVLRARAVQGTGGHATALPRGLRSSFAARGSLAAAAAAVLVVVLFVSGAAEGALQVFQPQQIQVVRVSTAGLRGFPDLSAYGTSNFTPAKPQYFTDAAPAAASVNMAPPAAPATSVTLPPVTGYVTVPRSTGTFRFEAGKARAAAAAAGKDAPPMPAGLDGTTLYVSGGPAIAEIRGVDLSQGAGSHPDLSGMGTSRTALVVAVGQAPAVTSDGASVATIQNYLVSLPGVSPELAAGIRAIQDPAHTVPIPLPDVSQLQTASVDLGNRIVGTYVGDNSLHLGGIIWISGNLVHMVAGTYSQSELTQLARSLAAR